MVIPLSIANVNNTFAGAFQDVPNLTPGTSVTVGGFDMTPGGSVGLGVELRIEWRNASGDFEVSRTANVVPTLTGEYTPFSLTATVPAGADTARVVYAIQSFTGPSDSGVVYVDDVSVLVPEPSMAMAGLVGLGLAWLRRGRR